MIDIKLIRENPEIVINNIKRKAQTGKLKLVDNIIEKDTAWRKMKSQADELRAERNTVSKQINEAMKAKKDAKALLKKAKSIPEEIEKVEVKSNKLMEEINSMLSELPNIMSKETPLGKDASENVEIKKWGKIKKFDFPIKNHVELAESLDLADFDASAKASGSGFYYLKNELALLNQALIRFTIDSMYKKGYTYIEPPLMLHGKEIFASMDKAAIAQSVYSIKDEDLHLIGTSEQALLALHAEQTLKSWEMPKKYFSYTMCFRKEVGAHGINDKGLWRTHQFNKVEQFAFCHPDDSIKIYDELMKNTEDILQDLDLPYRIIEICSGDLADWKYRSADFEVYRPTTKEYGEIMSLSNCTDYQARNIGIKFIDKQGNKGSVHTLNNTALATSRIMVAILENNQNKDGSITIPKVLVPYMHNITKIEAKK
ncbi:MAG: serine--tRNA ligase [Nanoarchaeota archaeon]|nr:serine--tRNA ligase [Nanoarchaeota archaeon]